MLDEKLQYLRKERNISQEELANALDTSRQAVSKWERGIAYPDIDKLKDLAVFFNVSIDYLLDFELENMASNKFIERLEDEIKNNTNNISVDEIKIMIIKNSNDIDLLTKTIEYLFYYWNNTRDDKLLDLIIEYTNKAMIIGRNSKKVSINDLHQMIISCYLMKEEYALIKEYVKKHKVLDVDFTMAEVEFCLGNYEKSKKLTNEIFLNNVVEMISSNIISISLLVKQNKIDEAYELNKWTISFINSIESENDSLSSIIYPFILINACFEKYYHLDYLATVSLIKEHYLNIDIKYYNGDSIRFVSKDDSRFFTIFDGKESIYKIIEKLEGSIMYKDIMDIFKEVYGG